MELLLAVLAAAAVVMLASAAGMIPTQTVFERMMVLLGNDTLTFAKTSSDLNQLKLAKAAFNPVGVALGDLTEADFDGYDARPVAGGVTVGNDPATGDSVMTMANNGTAFTWETTGTGELPQTIYGWYITDLAGTTLYAAQTLSTPVTLTAANQVVSLPGLPTLRQLSGSVV